MFIFVLSQKKNRRLKSRNVIHLSKIHCTEGQTISGGGSKIKRTVRVVFVGIMILSGVNTSAKLDLKGKIKNFRERSRKRIELVKQRLRERWNDPEVQMHLAEIRERHRESSRMQHARSKAI
ncbi:MAG: hypothetical protein GY750_04530 [Lentisphaerae bacterium]|nr:hypothetical protein [Lentisphaerota bacterium]MCP4100677.1 hypothetical protein [Lentisphaerota bacterium]